jgi:molybdopterin converting factor small subunit
MSIVDCRLSIDLFGVLVRLAGERSVALSVAPGVTIAEALALLASQRPELATLLPNCACAIGDTVVPRTRALTPGARVALLPPVSGG